MENLVNTIRGIQVAGTFQNEVPEDEEARRMLIKKIHSSASATLSNLILYYIGVMAIAIIVKLVS